MSGPAPGLRIWVPLSLGAVALVATSARAAPASVPLSALKKCAEISAVAPRLVCYDQLAGREPTPDAAAVPSSTAAGASSASTVNSASPPAAAPKQSFGLYSAEHPAVAVQRAASLTAKVIAIGSGSNGHPVVTLEGDQVWELDDADPLLGTGDTVTIKRGTLGSFIMTTSAGRIHRLRRIR